MFEMLEKRRIEENVCAKGKFFFLARHTRKINLKNGKSILLNFRPKDIFPQVVGILPRDDMIKNHVLGRLRSLIRT